jgi:hypothetical protein
MLRSGYKLLTSYLPKLRNTERPVSRHLTIDELNAGLPEILTSPKDEGNLRAIVIRPAKGERCDLSPARLASRVVRTATIGPRPAGSPPRTANPTQTCRSAS